MASYPLRQAAAVQAFQCLGDQCEDTCCKGWGMQLTQETVAKYEAEAPELLEAVTSGEAEHIMKRDPATDYCVKFDQGWCGVHAKYGESFLGDACHFFPRVTRRLGESQLMTASLSCPEIVRLGIMQGLGFLDEAAEIDRLPHSLKNYLPEGLSADKALEVHRLFLRAVMEEGQTPERALARLRSVAASLQMVDAESWAVAAGFYWSHSESRLPNAEAHPADPFNLLNALQGLIGASRPTARPRLDQTIADMQIALDVMLDWKKLTIHTTDHSLSACQATEKRWRQEWAPHFEPILKRWLQAQLSVACFPFAGLGDTLTDRVTILGVRFATLKLALMCACQARDILIDEGETVRIIQSLARFLDHLADPALSLQIYTEPGWTREARLRALIGDY